MTANLTLQQIDGHWYWVSGDGTVQIAADPPPPAIPNPDVLTAQPLIAALTSSGSPPVSQAVGLILSILTGVQYPVTSATAILGSA
jgi:hypothetical protein